MKNKYHIPILVIISITLIGTVLAVLIENHKQKIIDTEIEYVTQSPIKDTLQFEDSVYTYIFKLRIQHPHIVYAQMVLESATFNSKLFHENNNMCGMKIAMQRPTTAIGVKNNYAVYHNWKECILDYAIWQSIYARNLSEDEYLKKLSSLYAEDKEYVNKLRQIYK
ncbi:MAG: glucosaminidase domain-containing protein [Flavobacteriales bacterium]|nr:glucosaminidase domain-containing protein [Flavobacteriales bacterium]